MPAPHEVFSIICDDVRREQRNKFSLMGVYASGILVPDVPFRFSKFFLAQQLENAEGIRKCDVTLQGPKSRIESASFDVHGNKATLTIYLGFDNLILKEEGLYRFEARYSGKGEPVTIVKEFSVRIDPSLKNAT